MDQSRVFTNKMKAFFIFLGVLILNGISYIAGYRDAIDECLKIADDVLEELDKNEKGNIE